MSILLPSKIFGVFIITGAAMLNSCKTSGPGLFGKKTPHQQYADRITSAGLHGTALGKLWLQAAAQSLLQPLQIQLPYKETGYFAPERPVAAGLRFPARRGEKISISLEKKPINDFVVYIDLWKLNDQSTTSAKHVASSDTVVYKIEYEVDDDGSYVLRIQPELLRGGEYTLTIATGPSLAYPIKAPGKNHIKSFWGADRDGGSRKHEGIDLFAPFRTPVVAAASGIVTAVNENNLGGKVVWLRPESKKYTLYYAHLDEQLVRDGQEVKVGDTLGLMGHTGNARFTSPHLHFGIYTFGGAIDPLPFVNPIQDPPANITAQLDNLGKLGRISKPTNLSNEPTVTTPMFVSLSAQTLLRIEGATSSWFKVSLPDGQVGFVNSRSIQELKEPLRRFTLSAEQPLFDSPDSLAARKTILLPGEIVKVLAGFRNYYFVATNDDQSGWIIKQ